MRFCPGSSGCVSNTPLQSFMEIWNWQPGIVAPIFKKGDQRMWSSYMRITLFSLTGKVYARVYVQVCQWILSIKSNKELVGHMHSWQRSWNNGQVLYSCPAFGVSWEYEVPVCKWFFFRFGNAYYWHICYGWYCRGMWYLGHYFVSPSICMSAVNVPSIQVRV